MFTGLQQRVYAAPVIQDLKDKELTTTPKPLKKVPEKRVSHVTREKLDPEHMKGNGLMWRSRIHSFGGFLTNSVQHPDDVPEEISEADQ